MVAELSFRRRKARGERQLLKPYVQSDVFYARQLGFQELGKSVPGTGLSPTRRQSCEDRCVGGNHEDLASSVCGGIRNLMDQDADEAIAVLHHAIDLGITYIDTAHEYGEHGESEMRIGEVMKTRRKEVLLATKFSGRKADEAKRMIETSLQRLQTDHVDVLHIHGLGGADELAAIEAPDGALKALYWARDQKMTRFVGVTSHTDPHTLAAALERHDFDCTQLAR